MFDPSAGVYGRFPPLGPVGVRGNIDQGSNQPQQRLLLRPSALSQEGPDFNMRQTASGRRVGLVDNERVPVRRLSTEEPRIAVRAAVQLSTIWHMRSHACRLA